MRVDYMQMKFLHPKLRKLLKWVEAMLGFELTGTSIHRMDDMGFIDGDSVLAKRFTDWE